MDQPPTGDPAARAHDEEAARRVFDAHAERLMALARRRIGQRLAGRVDPEDVVQSVFRTFFQRASQGRFHFEHEDDLCKLLVRITVRKTLRQIAFHRAAKRDFNRELAHGRDADERLDELLDNEPTSEEAVTFLDELEHFFARLQPDERQILELRLQGHGTEEIAQQMGVYDRKVRRVLERIRAVAEQTGLGAD